MPTIDDVDYDAPDTLVVGASEQLKALADEVRSEIVQLLRERARSIQQLSEELEMPKGTVGHHVKVLEKAGLIRVVRTRRVRAVVEKFYGRTARLFLFQTEDPAEGRALAAVTLRQAAGEIERAPEGAGFGIVRARLSAKDRARLERRLKRLLDDFRAADAPAGVPASLAFGLWNARTPDA